MTEFALTFANLSIALHSISMMNACHHIINLMVIKLNSHYLLQCICTSVSPLLYSVQRLLDKPCWLVIHFLSFEEILAPSTNASFQPIHLPVLLIVLLNDTLDSFCWYVSPLIWVRM